MRLRLTIEKMKENKTVRSDTAITYTENYSLMSWLETHRSMNRDQDL